MENEMERLKSKKNNHSRVKCHKVLSVLQALERDTYDCLQTLDICRITSRRWKASGLGFRVVM